MFKKVAGYFFGGALAIFSLAILLVLALRQWAPGPVVTIPLYALRVGDILNLQGRILHSYSFPDPVRGESTWRKIVRNVLRMQSRELKNHPVRLEIGSSMLSLRTDSDGFVRYKGFWNSPLPESFRWRLTLEGGTATTPWTKGWSILSDSFVVVSDIDDTLLVTNVASKTGLVNRILAKDVWDLRPVPGAAQFLQMLVEKGAKIVYLSGSPWNMHDQLSQFLQLRGFPDGALILRNFGLGYDSDPIVSSGEFKKGILPALLEPLDGGRILLLGDSGEQDPEVYADLMTRIRSKCTLTAIRNAGGAHHGLDGRVLYFDTFEELQTGSLGCLTNE